MADVPEDTEVKVAVEAADTFTKNYYETLNRSNGAKQIAAFYVKPSPDSPLKPDITINGNIVKDLTDLERLFGDQPDKTRYEVESFDCQVVNTNFSVGAPDHLLAGNAAGKKMSVLVLVSGNVRIPGETHGFTDNVYLVPNWEITNRKDAREKKAWLVQSQTFRMVL